MLACWPHLRSFKDYNRSEKSEEKEEGRRKNEKNGFGTWCYRCLPTMYGKKEGRVENRGFEANFYGLLLQGVAVSGHVANGLPGWLVD